MKIRIPGKHRHIILDKHQFGIQYPSGDSDVTPIDAEKIATVAAASASVAAGVALASVAVASAPVSGPIAFVGGMAVSTGTAIAANVIVKDT